MIKIIPALVVALLFAGTAQAVDLTNLAPYIVLSVGESADTLTTVRFLKNGHCSEGNPHLGSHPSVGKLVLWTAVPVGLTALATFTLTRPELPKPVRVVGKLLSYGAGGWGGYHALRNYQDCGW